MKKALKFIERSVLFENPALVYMLGLCPLLATSTSLISGLGVGVTALVVLVLSGAVISLVGKLIPDSVKSVSYMVIIAFFVAVAELLLSTFLPELSAALGIYLPILTVSGIAFARAEAAEGEAFGTAALNGLSMGLGYLAAGFVISFVRELLGRGTLFGFRIFPEEYGAIVIISPAGALIVLGFLLVLFRMLVSGIKKREGKQ